jgi:hypothetical protein
LEPRGSRFVLFVFVWLFLCDHFYVRMMTFVHFAQVKVVGHWTEEELLADSSMSKDTARGLLWRIIFWCLFKFALRGDAELYGVKRTDFAIGFDHKGEYVEYHERSSKNGKATLKRFQPEHFWLVVKVYDIDVC